MSATFIDLIGYLVLFMLAALLLWLRGALATREEGWRRRRVNENAEVPASIMRTGVAFIAGTIVISWVLTSVAVAHPLTDAWQNLDVVWSNVRDRLDGVFGGLTNPDSRISGNSFGTRFTVTGSWFANDSPVLLVSEDHAYYLQTATYDIYTGHGWASSGGDDRSGVAASSCVFPGPSPEKPGTSDGFEAKTITVKLDRAHRAQPVHPGRSRSAYRRPRSCSEPAGPAVPWRALVAERDRDAGRATRSTRPSPRHVTETQLRNAGTRLPRRACRALYMDASRVTPGGARARASRSCTRRDATTPYDQAKALAHFLPRRRAAVVLDERRRATGGSGPGRLLPVRHQERAAWLLPVLRERDGHDGPQPGPAGTRGGGLLAGRADRAVGVRVPRVERPRLGAGLLPRLRLADFRGDARRSIRSSFVLPVSTGHSRLPITGVDDATQRLLEGPDPSNVFTQPSSRPISGGPCRVEPTSRLPPVTRGRGTCSSSFAILLDRRLGPSCGA